MSAKFWDVEVATREYRNTMGFNSCVAQLGGIKAVSAKQAAYFVSQRGYKTFFIKENGKTVYKSINGKWEKVEEIETTDEIPF